MTIKALVKDESYASFLSGGVAGAVSRTVVSPFERAKILLQLQGPEAQKAYRGMFPTIWKMYLDEGWRGWFRGNTLNCVRIFPYSAVQFAVFEKCKALLAAARPNGDLLELTDVDRLIAGSMGGIVSVAATYPLDLVRARITVQTASLSKLKKGKMVQAPGVWATMREVVRNEGGVLALYRGIVPTTMGVAPYVAINFAMYEHIRDTAIAAGVDFNPVWKLGAGACSSFVGGVLIYPLDLLRKRYQVASMAGGELGFRYTSVFHALKTIFTEEGFFGAYKGLTANLYKIVPSMAVSWLCYDTMKAAIARW